MNLFLFLQQSRLVKKRELKGLLFVLPFLIGFLAFILIPIIQSLIYSFSDLTFEGKVNLELVGIENFKRAFLVDVDFRKILLSSLSDMLTNVPIILIFSMLIAVFLNGKFVGQPLFQIIFFIPVILSSGIMPGLFSGDLVRTAIINAESASGEATSMFNANLIGDLLLKMNLPSQFINYIQYAIINILDVLNSSGIQILVFLIALKSIPASLYEASSIEGATVWEAFWKITFPMVLPQLLVNVVYTIIDAFSNNQNAVMTFITDFNFGKFNFGYGAALAWVYFFIAIVVICISVWLVKKLMKQYV